MNNKPMRIRVPLIVEVDVDAWRREYAEPEPRNEIRAEILERSREAVDAAFSHIAGVSVRFPKGV